MKRYYIISTLLHVLLLVGAFKLSGGNSTTNKQGTGFQSETDKTNVLPKSTIVDIVDTSPVDEKDKNGLLPPDQQKKNECKSWYGGIGITQDLGMIAEVHKGYPADLAGIQPGDIIVYQSEPDIRGEPGTPIIIRVNRFGTQITFQLTREKICYDGSKP